MVSLGRQGDSPYAMERQMPAQKINQQWLDNIMPWWQNRGNVP
jgi:hypothetical protein